MPKIKSAKKALRQSVRHRAQNVARSEAYKSAIKTYKKLVGEKKLDAAETELVKVYKSLDKAAKVGTIKKNKASRLKGRLARLLR